MTKIISEEMLREKAAKNGLVIVNDISNDFQRTNRKSLCIRGFVGVEELSARVKAIKVGNNVFNEPNRRMIAKEALMVWEREQP